MAEEKEGTGSKGERDRGEKGEGGGADKKAVAAGSAAPGSKKIMFWGIIAGIIILEIPIMFFMIKLTRPKSAHEVTAEKNADSLHAVSEKSSEVGLTLEKPIEALVNVAGTDGERFLKAVVVLEYSDPEAASEKEKGGGGGHGEGKPKKSKMTEELEKRVPKFKSMLIHLLSTKTLVELNEPDAKEKIRKELLRAVNNSLPTDAGGAVIDVLFDQFIIQ